MSELARVQRPFEQYSIHNTACQHNVGEKPKMIYIVCAQGVLCAQGMQQCAANTVPEAGETSVPLTKEMIN